MNSHPFFSLTAEGSLFGRKCEITLANLAVLKSLGFKVRESKDRQAILAVRKEIEPQTSDSRGELHAKVRTSLDLASVLDYFVDAEQRVVMGTDGKPWLSQIVCDPKGQPKVFTYRTRSGIVFRHKIFRNGVVDFAVVIAKIPEQHPNLVQLSVIAIQGFEQGHDQVKCQQTPWPFMLNRERLMRKELLEIDSRLRRVLSEDIPDSTFDVFGPAIIAAIRNLSGELPVVEFAVEPERKYAKSERKAEPKPKVEAAPVPPAPNPSAATDTLKKVWFPRNESQVGDHLAERYVGGDLRSLNLNRAAIVGDLRQRTNELGDYSRALKAFVAEFPTKEALAAKFAKSAAPPVPSNGAAETGAASASDPADNPTPQSFKASADQERKKRLEELKRQLSQHFGFGGKHFGNEGALAKSILEELEKGANEEQLFAALPTTLAEALASRGIEAIRVEDRPREPNSHRAEDPDFTEMKQALGEYFATTAKPPDFVDGRLVRVYFETWQPQQEAFPSPAEYIAAVVSSGQMYPDYWQEMQERGLLKPRSGASASPEAGADLEPSAAGSADPETLSKKKPKRQKKGSGDSDSGGGTALADAFAAAQKLEAQKIAGLKLPTWLQAARNHPGVSLEELKAARRHGEKSEAGMKVLATLAATETPAPTEIQPAAEESGADSVTTEPAQASDGTNGAPQLVLESIPDASLEASAK